MQYKEQYNVELCKENYQSISKDTFNGFLNKQNIVFYREKLFYLKYLCMSINSIIVNPDMVCKPSELQSVYEPWFFIELSSPLLISIVRSSVSARQRYCTIASLYQKFIAFTEHKSAWTRTKI